MVRQVTNIKILLYSFKICWTYLSKLASLSRHVRHRSQELLGLQQARESVQQA